MTNLFICLPLYHSLHLKSETYDNDVYRLLSHKFSEKKKEKKNKTFALDS